MMQILLNVKEIFDVLSTILLIYTTLSYSQKARDKYQVLKLADGKKHIILVLVLVFFIVNRVIGRYTDTNPATKKDVQEVTQSVKDGQQVNEELWNQARSEIKKDKWPLDGSWNLDSFDLMDQKIKIVLLADQAMWYQSNGGDYASYQELWDLKHRSNFPQSFVEDQLLRVNSVLRFANSTVRRIPLCKNNKNIDNMCLEVQTEADFEVGSVVSQLSHPLYWVSRAKSAYLLHFLTPEMIQKSGVSWETVLDALYEVFSGSKEIHKDSNVLIRYMAWESFRKHTCFADEKALFDVPKTIAWWKQEGNRQKVLNALENGRHSPFCQD